MKKIIGLIGITISLTSCQRSFDTYECKEHPFTLTFSLTKVDIRVFNGYTMVDINGKYEISDDQIIVTENINGTEATEIYEIVDENTLILTNRSLKFVFHKQ